MFSVRKPKRSANGRRVKRDKEKVRAGERRKKERSEKGRKRRSRLSFDVKKKWWRV